MAVTYISHSGFLLETETAYFLFDYYRGRIPHMNPEKALVIFVSHRHGDHYNPAIFELGGDRAQYVLSKDVPVKRQFEKYAGTGLKERVTLVEKREKSTLRLINGRNLEIETLKSTDEGVAFWLSYEGETYYHAGDLNLWVWEGESKQYNNNMRANYFRELERLKGRKIDIAFVPLDPRQGKEAFGGMESFMQYTDTRQVFPMHFWGDFGIIDRFLEAHPEYQGRIAAIKEEGQVFVRD